jgi:Putative transposase/Transposase zinc-binding domain
MPRPVLELADILRRSTFAQKHSLSKQQNRVIDAISACRTAVLGTHVDECSQCGHIRISYNSCRNRHCPKCQSLARAEWLEARKAELLPVEYFHVVFTLPEQIARVGFYNQETIYNILFRVTAETLLTIARDPKHLGADIGFFAILHTWGQNLHFHPHLHCVVPGGGLSPDQTRWIACRPGFFLPVRVLSRLFRRLFVQELNKAFERDQLQFIGQIDSLRERQAFLDYLAPIATAEWVVYAKAPFGGPSHVLDYLGRYTHRVAISNDRLIASQNGHVTFRYKDYRSSGQEKLRSMTLPEEEFIRRFLTHVLPPGFHKIRFFGLLCNRRRKYQLALCRRLLQTPIQDLLPKPGDYRELYQAVTGRSLKRCPECGKDAMVCVLITRPVKLRFDTS